ncbi:MAG: hypothetical protein U5N58_01685 [Actinomycetota bacterium]|nr:hypothetical protein [Actinomycetota bacterium]
MKAIKLLTVLLTISMLALGLAFTSACSAEEPEVVEEAVEEEQPAAVEEPKVTEEPEAEEPVETEPIDEPEAEESPYQESRSYCGPLSMRIWILTSGA